MAPPHPKYVSSAELLEMARGQRQDALRQPDPQQDGGEEMSEHRRDGSDTMPAWSAARSHDPAQRLHGAHAKYSQGLHTGHNWVCTEDREGRGGGGAGIWVGGNAELRGL
ncbi:hypothetical protein AAFF_G00019130 [Aldrovandia affinis]|uniref:Uncharacterized protein n=1 Tax=Aldrovandia affinis TaxID=143900 RepID=A0AAD7S7P3_9TELE|nr:hypothetical protein AAFF_G00019130 [Aldrovandia affinis]